MHITWKRVALVGLVVVVLVVLVLRKLIRTDDDYGEIATRITADSEIFGAEASQVSSAHRILREFTLERQFQAQRQALGYPPAAAKVLREVSETRLDWQVHDRVGVLCPVKATATPQEVAKKHGKPQNVVRGIHWYGHTGLRWDDQGYVTVYVITKPYDKNQIEFKEPPPVERSRR